MVFQNVVVFLKSCFSNIDIIIYANRKFFAVRFRNYVVF